MTVCQKSINISKAYDTHGLCAMWQENRHFGGQITKLYIL